MTLTEEEMIALNHEDSYEYFIDAEDRIVSVDSNWLSFARENQASTLTAETVVGEPLFRFITDQETHHIYQLILEKVRSTCEKVIIPFRCDGPRVRRFMELQISQEGGLVKFVGRTVREESREPVLLFDCFVKRSEDFIRVCSWCKRIDVSGN